MRGPGELTHNCPTAGFLNPSPGVEMDHGQPRVQLRDKRTTGTVAADTGGVGDNSGWAGGASSAQLTSETDGLPTLHCTCYLLPSAQTSELGQVKAGSQEAGLPCGRQEPNYSSHHQRPQVCTG